MLELCEPGGGDGVGQTPEGPGGVRGGNGGLKAVGAELNALNAACGAACRHVARLVAEHDRGRKVDAEVLGSLVEKPKGRPTLVPVSDRRPAITTMDAAQEFTEITEV